MQIQNVRRSNFELLRIFAMLLIVMHHFSVHSPFVEFTNALSVNRLGIQFMEIGGKLGVNLFVLISGYFMCTSKEFKVKKIIVLFLQILMYSVLCYSVICIATNQFSIREVLRTFLPITFVNWWFASTYFVLLFFTPFINKLIAVLSKQSYRSLLIIMAVMWVLIPTVTNTDFQSNNLIWFVFLYLLAGYIRIYPEDMKISKKASFWASVIITLMMFLSVVVFDILGTKIGWFASKATYFFGTQKLPLVVLSISIFLLFKDIDIKTNKFINAVASTTFGVYLLHDHSAMRDIIWNRIFRVGSFQDSWVLLIYGAFCTVSVFVICSAIEYVRKLLFDKAFEKIADYAINKTTKILKLKNND